MAAYRFARIRCKSRQGMGDGRGRSPDGRPRQEQAPVQCLAESFSAPPKPRNRCSRSNTSAREFARAAGGQPSERTEVDQSMRLGMFVIGHVVPGGARQRSSSPWNLARSRAVQRTGLVASAAEARTTLSLVSVPHSASGVQSQAEALPPPRPQFRRRVRLPRKSIAPAGGSRRSANR